MEAMRLQDQGSDPGFEYLMESDEWVPFEPKLTVDELRRRAADGCLFCSELMLCDEAEESSGSATIAYRMTSEPSEKKSIMAIFAALQEDEAVGDVWGAFTLLTMQGTCYLF